MSDLFLLSWPTQILAFFPRRRLYVFCAILRFVFISLARM